MRVLVRCGSCKRACLIIRNENQMISRLWYKTLPGSFVCEGCNAWRPAAPRYAMRRKALRVMPWILTGVILALRVLDLNYSTDFYRREEL